jgi:hypothetical protein
MVVIKKYTSSQISELANITGRVLYDSTLNILKYNNSASYSNILVHKDDNNNLSSINDVVTTGTLGINTSSPDKQVEINSSSGDCLRLTYNDNNGSAANYSDFTISNSGDLTITPSGNDTTLSSTLTVNDATTLSSTLDVTGNVNLNNDSDATSSTNGGSLTVDGGAAIAKKLFVGTDLTVGGDLFVSGTTTTVNSTTVDITDNILKLNSGPSGSSYDSGLIIERFQSSNDLASGDVISDIAKETQSIQSATNNTITLANTSNSTNDYYKGWWVKITSGSGIDQVRKITAYNGITKVATLENNFTTNPSNNDTISLYNKPFSTLIWQESNNRFITAFAQQDVPTGQLQILDYADFACNGFSIVSTTPSTSNSTGALVLPGGIGISNTTDATSSTNGGTFTTAGGAAIAKKLYVGTDLNVGNDLFINRDLSVSRNLTVTGPILAIPTGDTASRPNPASGGYIRYNTQTSQFEGYGAGNAWGSLGGVSDVNQDTKILAEDGAGTNDDNLRFFNNGSETMRLTSTGLLGLGTNAPDKKLEINSSTGDCLRLTYNDANGSAANYTDFSVSNSGDLTISPSGGNTNIDGTLSISGIVSITDITDSTSTSTGALVLSGGMGVSKTIHAGIKMISPIFSFSGLVGGGSATFNLNNFASTTSLNNPNQYGGRTPVAYSPTLNMYVLGKGQLSVPSSSSDGISTSIDGITWTTRTRPITNYTIYFNGAAWVGGTINKFFVYGSTETSPHSNKPVVFYSSDGITWSQATTHTSSVNWVSIFDLAFNSNTGRLVLSGGNGSQAITSYSDDGGVSWTTNYISISGSIAGGDPSITSIMYNSTSQLFIGTFGYANSSGNRIITSSNGTSWTARTTETSLSYKHLAYNATDNVMIAVPAMTSLGTTIIRSTNGGTTWSTITISGSSITPSRAIYIPSDPGYFLVFLDNSTTIYYSSDNGLTWNTFNTNITASGFTYVEWNTTPAYNPSNGQLLLTNNSTTKFNYLTATDIASDYAGLSVSSNFVNNGSKSGFKWYTSSSSDTILGTQQLELGSSGLNIMNTTNATSTITGALKTAGGLGVVKDVFIGGNSSLSGTLGVEGMVNLNDATDASSSTSGALIVDGGVGIAKKLYVGTDLDIGGDSTMTGTLDVTGATTLSSTLDVTGLVNLNDTTDASSSTSGALIVDGGVGIAKKLYVGTDLDIGGDSTMTGTLNVTGATTLSNTLDVTGLVNLNDATDASSSTSGALIVDGGVGIAKKLYVGTDLDIGGDSTMTGTLDVTGATTLSSTLDVTGLVNLNDATDASSSTSGALIVDGGVGIAKKLYVGTDLDIGGDSTMTGTLDVTGATTLSSTLDVTGLVNLNNSTDASSSTSGALIVDGGVGIAKKLYVGTDLAVGGNLTVSGTTTTVNSTIVEITDNTLKLNSGPSGSNYDSGFVIERYQTSNDTSTGDVVADSAKLISTLAGASTNTITLQNTASSVTNYYKGWWVKITSGSGNNQVRKIASYDGTTKVATLETNFTTTPSTSDSIELFNKTLSTFVWQESNNRFITAYAQQDMPSGQLQIIDYADFACNGFSILSADASTSTTTGALTLAGGIGIANTTDAISSTNGGTITTAGGVAIAKKLFVGTDLSIGGNSSLTGTLGVTGATTLSSTLDVTGLVNLNDTTDASSSTTGALIVDGGVGIAKKLFVGTDLSIGGNSSLTGTLGVTGATTLSSTLGVTGATNLSSTLGVTGAISFTNTTDATNSTTGGCLTISGGAAVAKKLYVGTDLSIGGNSTLTGTLGVTGATTLSSTLGVTGATTLSSTLGVTGATTLSNTLGVTGVVSFTNTTDATSSTSGGCLTISGGTAIAKKLYVGTDLSIGGNSTLTGTLGVTGATTLSSTLGVTGAATLSSTLGVTGATTLSSTLAVTGNSTLTGNVGIGTTSPDKKVEINSSTGDCLRLTYDDANGTADNYVDILVTSGGDLTLTPSGGDINITTHNGSTTGLKLNGTLITSTATELNYVDTTPGIAEASKALILDSNRDIVNINYLEAANGVFLKPNSANNTIDYPLSLIVTPNTEASVGLGIGIEFNSVNDNDDIYNAAYINFVSSDISNNAESGYFDFKLANVGTIDSVMTLSNNGVLTCTSFVETSDRRVKENIQDTISLNSLDKILQVNVKTYNFIKDSNKVNHTGIIAQELKEIIPEAVVVSKKEELDDFHSIHYTELVPHLINCIKELHKEVQDLKEALNKKIN